MEERVCLITGGNAGIGKAAAIRMAKQGWTVAIACRNKQRGETAIAEIRRESENARAEFLECDMSSFRSIQRLAARLSEKHSRLDCLIHNAADFDIAQKSPRYSAEGIEKIWATNHLGPVLLTDLLSESLRASPGARIITVASKGLLLFPFLKIRLNDPEFRQGGYSVEKAYYQSKLAQVMYTYWLARKWEREGVVANCCRVTNVKIDIGRYPQLSAAQKRLYALKSRFSISPDQMAAAYEYLACSPEAGGISGKYLDETCRQIRSSAYSRDEKNIEALMALTQASIARARGD
jgi:NAD(P)-dependent dehydrogenase (short-subunit alcohol dehydrogenase family)